MKKRVLSCLLLLALCLCSCGERTPEATSSVPSAESELSSPEEAVPVNVAGLFTWLPHKPPFDTAENYRSLLEAADGKTVVCSWSLDENINDVWNYRFVEMEDGIGEIKAKEDTIILQSSPYLKNIWFYEFIIFPDGTVYGVYPPSVSARVAKVCGVETTRDFGAIFTPDLSEEELKWEKIDCFLPEGVFDLLERELGEIETEGYIFEVPEEFLHDDPTGFPFATKGDLVQSLFGKGVTPEDINLLEYAMQFACYQRYSNDDGTIHWETVYRWPGQDPIWEIPEIFVPTPEGNLYDGIFDLFLIDATLDLTAVKVYATYAPGTEFPLPEGYEHCAGMDYGAIYTFDLTAEGLSYTVEYGFLGEYIAEYISVES